MGRLTDYLLTHYDGLALDVDGSSARNEPIHLKTVKQIMNGDGHHIDWDWWQSNLGSGQDGIYRKLCAMLPHFAEKISEHDFIEAWKTTYCDMVMNATAEELARPGITTLVDLFHQAGKPVCAVSASERKMVEANLATIGIRSKLQFALAAEDLRDMGLLPKPAPDSYTYAFGRMGVPACRALVLEDTNKGVVAASFANAGGIIGVHYANQPQHAEATYHVSEEGHLIGDLKAFLSSKGRFPQLPANLNANFTMAEVPGDHELRRGSAKRAGLRV